MKWGCEMENNLNQQNESSSGPVDRGAEIAALGERLRLSGFEQPRSAKGEILDFLEQEAAQAEILQSLEDLGAIKRAPYGGGQNGPSLTPVDRGAEITALAESMRLSGFEQTLSRKDTAATQAKILDFLEQAGAINANGRGSQHTRKG